MKHELVNDCHGATKLEASIMIGVILALVVPIAFAVGLWSMSQWETLQACANSGNGQVCAVASAGNMQ